MKQHRETNVYWSLVAQMAIHFVIMYLVMYTMIDRLEHFVINLNMTYMALMMVAPMGIIMLLGMRSMFPSRRLNLLTVSASAAVFLASFYGMRAQAGIGDAELLRAMIPHHSGAILMCEQASLSDPELITLCQDIVRQQEAEIAQMQMMLERR